MAKNNNGGGAKKPKRDWGSDALKVGVGFVAGALVTKFAMDAMAAGARAANAALSQAGTSSSATSHYVAALDPGALASVPASLPPVTSVAADPEMPSGAEAWRDSRCSPPVSSPGTPIDQQARAIESFYGTFPQCRPPAATAPRETSSLGRNLLGAVRGPTLTPALNLDLRTAIRSS